MRTVADFVVYSADDQAMLIVEVKNRKGVTDEWAGQMHRNLVDHGLVPPNLYFLLALREHFYLWKPGHLTESNRADYKVASKKILQQFANEPNLDSLSEHGLELLVNSWLSQVIGSRIDRQSSPELDWVFDSGLYDSISGGSIRVETGV